MDFYGRSFSTMLELLDVPEVVIWSPPPQGTPSTTVEPKAHPSRQVSENSPLPLSVYTGQVKKWRKPNHVGDAGDSARPARRPMLQAISLPMELLRGNVVRFAPKRRSAPSVPTMPWCFCIGTVWISGAVLGQTYIAGSGAGQVGCEC